MKKIKVLLSILMLGLFCSGYICFDEKDKEKETCSDSDTSVQIKVYPNTIRNIGGVTKFDRSQYITIHESPGANDLSDEDIRYLEDELEISYGRSGGTLPWYASQTKSDPENIDMPSIKHIKEMGERFKASKKERVKDKNTKDLILCGQPKSLHPLPKNKFASWGPRTNEAIAEYTAQFFKHYWEDNNRPKYFEVLNEPFVHAREIGTTIEALSEQHKIVAKRIHELCPNVKVGGYTAAWAEIEAGNFRHWENRQKKFMDIAGAEMDFFSTHIYDGINVVGEARNRTGSNSEAILDIIDQYSWLSYGVAKPQVISEYGLIPVGKGGMGNMKYSGKRSAAMIRSTNAQMLTFMNHPDRLIKTVPFFLGKALWTYGLKGDAKPGMANPFLLWRRLKDNSFVKTDLVKFYEFWKGVKGDWRYAISGDPDVLTHLLIDGKTINLILMNIESVSRKVSIKGFEGVNSRSISYRSLKTHSNPKIIENSLKSIPNEVLLMPGESVLLKIKLKEKVEIIEKIKETRCYATSYLKPIEEELPLVFEFKDVPTAMKGNAILRVSAGRENRFSSLPKSVKFNGKSLDIPSDWAGDSQKGRSMFFGTIEVPVPIELVKEVNKAEVIYSETGGKLASVILQVNTLKKVH